LRSGLFYIPFKGNSKTGADKEQRSRQYNGTAMSCDAVRKSAKIIAFVQLNKSYIKR
jgi:hypothetical protein